MDTHEDDLARARAMLAVAEAERALHPEDARRQMKCVALEDAITLLEQRRALERRWRQHGAN